MNHLGNTINDKGTRLQNQRGVGGIGQEERVHGLLHKLEDQFQYILTKSVEDGEKINIEKETDSIKSNIL